MTTVQGEGVGSVLIGIERRPDPKKPGKQIAMHICEFGDEKVARGWVNDQAAQYRRRIIWVKAGSPAHQAAKHKDPKPLPEDGKTETDSPEE